MWAFNRNRDIDRIKTERLLWNGPFSWPKYEKSKNEIPMPDVSGVYLYSFQHKDGYLIAGVGITKSTKKRFQQHKGNFKRGEYTVLDPFYAQKNGERIEIWHGWQYAKSHKDEFESKKIQILEAVDNLLSSYSIFIAELDDNRLRQRVEWAIVSNLYVSQESWADIIDRGMYLNPRHTYELPVNIHNVCTHHIYGLPEYLEV